MKKLWLRLALVVVLFALVAGVCACGNVNTDTPDNTDGPDASLQQFTGVTIESNEFTYDSQPHALVVSGSIPQDTKIEYENNNQTNAGSYTVKATLSKDNYETKTLSATLTINKAEFTDVTLKSKSFVYLGKICSLEVEGNIPENTKIEYTNNDKKEVGKHTVSATLTNPNYITKNLTATMTITAKTEIALSIINSLLNKPDPWSFLPDVFSPVNMAYTQMPTSGMAAFTENVSVGQIAKRSIGKQFNVLYEGLLDATSTINKLDDLFAVGATVANVYQTFINNSPDDYATFSGEAGGFKIKIILDGDMSTLLAGNSTINIELNYDAESGTRIGRLQLHDGIAIKYTSNENSLKLAVKTTINDVGNLKQIEFVRNDDTLVGYLREFSGTESKNLKTSGVIASNKDYTIIMSDKRETEDLIIKGYEEIYSSVTGEFLGGRVQETIKIVNYDTLWLHLSDVQGFNSVRVDDESNGLNIDSIYVNGNNTVFATKKVNPLIPTSSRRFDIEMKEVWYIVAETTDNKTEYKKTKTLIPMLFVQTEQTSNFATDVKEKNSYMSDVALPNSKISTVNSYYDTMKGLFDTVKNNVTYQDIQSYIGTKNEFFATI